MAADTFLLVYHRFAHRGETDSLMSTVVTGNETASIMRQVIHQAPIYEHVLESYEAETYVKGRTHVPRKNKLLRYAYLVFPIERHPRDAFFEMAAVDGYNLVAIMVGSVVAGEATHLEEGIAGMTLYREDQIGVS